MNKYLLQGYLALFAESFSIVLMNMTMRQIKNIFMPNVLLCSLNIILVENTHFNLPLI